MVIMTGDETKSLLSEMSYIKTRILLTMSRFLTSDRAEHHIRIFELAYNDLCRSLQLNRENGLSTNLSEPQKALLLFFQVNYLNRLSEQRMLYMFLNTIADIERFYAKDHVSHE